MALSREVYGNIEYRSNDGHWYSERNICLHCVEDSDFAKLAEERYSFGVYAGRYCDDCWSKSGYRDVDDPNAKFDPLDAGEVYDEIDSFPDDKDWM